MKNLLFIFFSIFFAFSVIGKEKKIIHVFVALCDNKNQGIVPVPEQLGNGNYPGYNLYWGAMYGVKTFLNKSGNWKLAGTKKNPADNVLERVVFRHKTNKAYLVADAYRGSKIKNAIEDFLDSAGKQTKNSGKGSGLYGNADLVVYVGHNGLMDFNIKDIKSQPKSENKKAIVLACKSKSYFLPHLMKRGCKPLLLTTNFMAPEAYTLDAAVSAWLSGKSNDEVRESAAQAYHKYQKCGLDGARRLFYTEQ